MTERDDRKRASEEDYFRKQDQELIEKMRRAAAASRAQSEMSAKTGLKDPALIAELGALGFTPETISLLPLVPIIQIAWAEGGVSPEERTLLVTLARGRGIAEGSAADRQLTDWMAHRPPPTVFASATRLIRAMIDTGAPEGGAMSSDDLIKYAESMAAVSGGFLGLGKISREERETLAKLAAALKAR